jgi:lipopolysaccharide transport system permease protein
MASRHRIVIEPDRQGGRYWKDLREYRGLFWFLAWRDLIVRYKQAVVGVAWSVIRPFITIVIFTVLFGKLGKFDTGGVAHYGLLVCAGTLAWQFFANMFSDASGSLVSNAGMLTKVYFPRILVPASSIVVSLVDFACSLLIFAILCIWYGYYPDWRIIALPLFLVLAIITSLGAGLLVSALYVKYRDFRFIIPFIIQFGLFLSPVGIPSSTIFGNPNLPVWVKYLYAANPMVSVIDGFRWSLLRGETTIWWPGFALSCSVGVLLLLAGFFYFRKMEKNIADVI